MRLFDLLNIVGLRNVVLAVVAAMITAIAAVLTYSLPRSEQTRAETNVELLDFGDVQIPRVLSVPELARELRSKLKPMSFAALFGGTSTFRMVGVRIYGTKCPELRDVEFSWSVNTGAGNRGFIVYQSSQGRVVLLSERFDETACTLVLGENERAEAFRGSTGDPALNAAVSAQVREVELR